MNQQSGYYPKDLFFDEEGRKKLISGISKISKAVGSTLGPSGNTVLIESPHLTSSLTITKDGVTVAKSIELLDPVENLAVRVIRQAADKTALVAGDGTTTSIVLAEAIIKEAMAMTSKEDNKSALVSNINKVCDEIVAELESMSTEISEEDMRSIATISANNDKEIGEIISEVYKSVGKNGIVTVEKSDTPNTHTKVVSGIRVKRGMASQSFINNHKKDECILENAYVLVTEMEVTDIVQIENIIKPVVQNRAPLLIIGDCSQNVINTLSANVAKNGLKFCVVSAPDFGFRRHEIMGDIALSIGATFFSEKTGDDLSIAETSDLGFVAKVVSDQLETILVKSDDEDHYDKEAIDKKFQELVEARDESNDDNYQKFLSERIASLNGGIGIIYVGGNTDIEQKELYDRIDDSVCAVKAALDSGVLPGGGVALHTVASKMIGFRDELDDDKSVTAEYKLAFDILVECLTEPIVKIFENAGLNFFDYNAKCSVGGTLGWDVRNMVYGDMIEMGIIDPLKVTVSALRNAVSVATTIISTNAIVTMVRSED